MDRKTKQIIQFLNSCENIKSQVSEKFQKIPLRYIWLVGIFLGTLYVLNTIPNGLVLTTYSNVENILAVVIASAIFSMMFAVTILMLVIGVLIFVVLTPMIQNKIREAKVILIDYPKIMREGSFNDKSVEIVKAYLRIVFKEELDTIRTTLKKEIKDEIKQTLTPATSGFNNHDDAIKKMRSDIDIIFTALFGTEPVKKIQDEKNHGL